MAKSNILIVIFSFLLLLNSCSSITKGAVEGLMNSTRADEVDLRQCFGSGRPFRGLTVKLNSLAGQGSSAAGHKKVLKVLLVHGIGSHQPGYSALWVGNIARSLNLNKAQEYYKEITLSHPDFPGKDLGTLRISRYFDDNGSREAQFFELTWGTIVDQDKSEVAYDNSGEYSHDRANINDTLKSFINDVIPDVILYYGNLRETIQVSVSQAISWMMSNDWDSLPDKTKSYCDHDSDKFLSELQDDYVFITHSLGSRIVSDALQRVAVLSGEDTELIKREKLLRDKDISIYMLSNQLPLLQLGREKPEVTDQINEICGEGAPRSSERLFRETKIIAFSDPNDLFSYAIQPNFIRENMDSRLCPTLTNVSINITKVIDLFGVGQFANPLKAHTGYNDDERVIKMISKGIGTDYSDQLIKERCTWRESVPDGF